MQENPNFGDTVRFTASFCLSLSINWQEAHLLWHPVRHRTCSCHQNKKFNAASPKPFKNTESTMVVQQQTKVPCHQHGKLQNYQLFISIILLSVSSSWCTFLHLRKPETFSKYRRKLLSNLQTGSQAASVYKTSLRQGLEIVHDLQNYWISKYLKTFEKLTYTRYIQKAHLVRTVNAVFFICIYFSFLLLQILIQCYQHSLA